VTAGVGGAPVHVFVAPNGNAFMRDIATWIAEAAALTGRDADVVEDGLPEVTARSTWSSLHTSCSSCTTHPCATSSGRRQRASASCTEQPETPWFHLSLDACRRGRLALDISPEGLDALRRHEVRAERLVLGAVPSMTAPTCR
jgi:hypothetical protein